MTTDSTVKNAGSPQQLDSTGRDQRVHADTFRATTSQSPANTESQYALAVTADALQMINKNTGSSSDIRFGKPMPELIDIVSKILSSKNPPVQLNSECGAGPIKMASWNNGLTLLFQSKQNSGTTKDDDWKFAGWLLGKPTGGLPGVTTMAGIGYGSPKAALEGAYTVKISTTTLGREFSTSAGLYGILGTSGKVEYMWGGVSCNFR